MRSGLWSRHWPLILAVGGGALLAWGSSRPEAWLLSLGGLGCWTWAAAATYASWQRSGLVVFFGALALHLLGVSWIFAGLNRNGANGPLITAVLAALSFGFAAGQHAVCYLLVRALFRRWALVRVDTQMMLAWSLGWGLNELARQAGMLAFPYLQLGTALIDAPGSAGWLPVVGAEGVSILMVGLFAFAASRQAWRAWSLARALVVWGGAWLAWAALGTALSHVEWTKRTARAPVVVHAMQSNFRRGSKWDVEARDHAFKWLTQVAARVPAGEVVVTPEFFLFDLVQFTPAELLDAVGATAHAQGIDILVGAPYAVKVVPASSGAVAKAVPSSAIFNAIVHFSPDRVDLYGKEHLVAFGEYAPLASLLAPIYKGVFDFPLNNLSEAPAPLTDNLYVAGQSVGTSICFEVSFPHLMARRAKDAAWLLAVSNDAWFNSPSHYEQSHLAARTRAAEFRKMFLRVNNVGQTALIGIDGAVLKTLPIGTEAVLTARLDAYAGTTPYAWIAGQCQGAALACLALLAVGLSLFEKRQAALRPLP